MNSLVVKVVKLCLIVAVLRHMELRVQHDFKELVLVASDDKVKRGIFYIWAPVSSHLRYFIFCGNTSLQKLLVASHSSSNDVSIVASYTAINEEFFLNVLFIDILVS